MTPGNPASPVPEPAPVRLAEGVRLSAAVDHEVMSQQAAGAMHEALRRDPRLLLGAATGSTPTRAYELFVEMLAEDLAAASQMRLLKLDEWGGLGMDDPATCEVYLRAKLVNPLRVPDPRYIAWNSAPADPAVECRRIAERLASEGPIGLCVLGLGTNGHLAFNEPGEALQPVPHVAQLSESSMAHPMLQWARSRPSFGLTVGMADILQSRQIVLLVSGRHKAAALNSLLQPTVSTSFPASFLWLHPNVTIFCDADAAGSLDVARATSP